MLIRTNISATENNIEALQIIYTDDHPKLKKVFQTRKNLENKLEEILDENIAAAAFELANLQGFIKSSEDELNMAKSELLELEEKDVALRQYVREVETNNKIYETFLERMKETNEVKELQSSNVRIIQSALLAYFSNITQYSKNSFDGISIFISFTLFNNCLF